MQKIQKFLFSGIFWFVFGIIAVEDIHEILAGDGLFLVQVLCQLVQLCAVLGQDANGLFVLGLDQLYHLPVDLALGLGTAGQRVSLGYDNWNSQIWMNIGSMQARGWEVGLTWRDEIGKDFSYDLGLNLSAVRNKAIKFSGDGPINVGGFNSDQIIRNEDGGFISRFYGWSRIGKRCIRTLTNTEH